MKSAGEWMELVSIVLSQPSLRKPNATCFSYRWILVLDFQMMSVEPEVATKAEM